jgi:hypothetical protein
MWNGGVSQWVGNARVRSHAGRPVFVMVWFLVYLVVSASDWDAFWNSMGKLRFLWVLLLAVLLYFIRSIKPVTVRVDEWGVHLDQDGEHATVAWTDVVWSDSSFSALAVVLEQRDDPVSGPLGTIEIDMESFTSVQCEQILDMFKWVRKEHSCAPITPHTQRPPVVYQRSWHGSTSLGLRVFLWSLGIGVGIFLFVVACSFLADGVVLLSLAIALGLIFLALLFVRAVGTYGSLTVTVDEVGVCLDRRYRRYVFAYADIACVTFAHSDLDGAARLDIKPTASYLARTNQRRMGQVWPKWSIYQQIFTRNQFADLRSWIVRGVEKAGGKYVPDGNRPKLAHRAKKAGARRSAELRYDRTEDAVLSDENRPLPSVAELQNSRVGRRKTVE